MVPKQAARRRFLRQGMAAAMAAAMPPGLLAANGSLQPRANPNFNADVELAFVARNGLARILPQGPLTAVQTFRAQLLKGPNSVLTELPDNYLGPILHLQRGQKVRIHFRNELSEPSIMHWHGLHVPQISDGHPMYTVAGGETFVYEFEVLNRAGTSFYHSHAHNLTAEQVYRGLAGLIKVSDAEEARLDLPAGEYDIPVVIQDRRFDRQNQLRYVQGMHERMLGLMGDAVLVNGRPDAIFTVKTRAYRARVVNGSNARIYKLAWNDGSRLWAIGSDAGLLPAPVSKPYIMLAPGERVELWLDFSGRALGEELTLLSLPFSGAAPAMGGGMMGGPAQGAPLRIACFKMGERVGDSPRMPERLADFRRLTERDADNASAPLPIGLSMAPMSARINGRTFAMDKVDEFERVALGSVKKIRIFHDHARRGGMGGMGSMGMSRMLETAHPIHLHGHQFQVLSRTADHADAGAYASVKDGFIDSGWKDTVLVMPGESVDVIKPFPDYKGLFLYHCHNLEHEDLGMMRQYLVE